MNLDQIKNRLDGHVSNWKRARQRVEEEDIAFKNATVYHENVIKAQKITQQVAEDTQRIAHERIASVVTKCLQDVFGKKYEFKIMFDQKRGKTEARLVFIKNDVEIDPASSCGGGVLDVAGLALRIACMALSRPRVRNLLILDEPLKFVSEDYRETVAEVVKDIADKMNIQILQITHIPEFMIGKVISIESKVLGS